MSTARNGHSTYDAEAGVRGELSGQPDDEMYGRKLVAGVDHARQQAELLDGQAVAVRAKADQVIDMWKSKAAEAQRIADAAGEELTRLEDELAERTGF